MIDPSRWYTAGEIKAFYGIRSDNTIHRHYRAAGLDRLQIGRLKRYRISTPVADGRKVLELLGVEERGA